VHMGPVSSLGREDRQTALDESLVPPCSSACRRRHGGFVHSGNGGDTLLRMRGAPVPFFSRFSHLFLAPAAVAHLDSRALFHNALPLSYPTCQRGRQPLLLPPRDAA